MGSLTRMRARNRLQTALEQRLATVDTPDATRAIYQDAVDRLCRIALDDAELDRLAREFAVDPESISFPAASGESAPPSDVVPPESPEPTITGWAPGEACPACEHSTVHAIVRAGMQFHVDGGWAFDETLAIYEAFCPECDWLPPVVDRGQPRAPDP